MVLALRIFSLCRTFGLPVLSKMSNPSVHQMERLEKNAEIAEGIIADIHKKLGDIERTKLSLETPEVLRLRQENEALRVEIEKWKELLILAEIKNGGDPVIRKPADTGKLTEVLPTAKESEPASAVKKGGKDTKSTADDTKLVKSKQEVVDKKGKKSQEDNKLADKTSTTSTTSSTAPPPSGNDEVDVSKLDFRIGLIIECDRHPDADALYVEKIDLGEGKPRTIISGLVKYVPIEEMRNRLVVVLTNLKPAKMRGILSEGMVMCASSPEKVEILIPPTGSAPGDLVEIEGHPRAPEAVLNPKKKIFETVQPHLKTNDKREATYKGTHLWTVPGKGVILSTSLTNTMIK